MFGTLNFTEYCEFSVRADEKYHAVLEEAQRIHSVAWYISMITDDYISLDEELQELEKQGNLTVTSTLSIEVSRSHHLQHQFYQTPR